MPKSTAVKRAALKAEEAHAAAYPTDPPPADPPADPPPVPPAEPPIGEPPADPPPLVAVETPPVEPPEDPSESWEQKYKTLQGMFNSEMPKMQSSLRELETKNEGLEGLIATFSAPPVAPVVATPSLLTAAEVEDYGAEMTDFVKRAAQDALAPELAGLRKENETLKSQNLQLQQTVGSVEANRGADAREVLLSTLAGEVPDWSVINQSQEFLQWLQQTDAFTGQIRHGLLLDAFDTNNAPRVIAFFTAFQRDTQLVAPHVPNVPAEPTVPLSSLVAPGKATVVTTPPPSDDSQDKIWVQSEISAFYRDVQRGKFAGKEAEKDRIEKAIVKAGREGRVR